jgi:putative lipoic acid-binding regulatory protein
MHFPVIFSLKIIGAVDANLEAIIVPVLNKHNVDNEHLRLSAKLSSEGKYTSFTATFMAESQEQLDNIYRELSGHPQIIMVL